MSTAREQFAAIQHRGATEYAGTALASSHGPVTRRVRRDRTVRAGVATIAGAGVVGAGTFGALQLRGSDAIGPMGIPSPSVTHQQVTVTIRTAANIDEVSLELATQLGGTPDAARAAIVAALPPEAMGDPEGWVPASRHQVAPDLEIAAKTLVGVTTDALQAYNVPRDRWHDTVTIASIITQEASGASDTAMVARVIQNRLDAGMMLEIDAPLRYASEMDGIGFTDEDFLTGEERTSETPYNTFQNEGLPPGAIGSFLPATISFAAYPPQGEWMYFVTVNPDTGDTRFAEDFEEHQDNVMLLQEWARENG